jgi:hypothetical protein
MPIPILIGLGVWGWSLVAASSVAAGAGGVALGRRLYRARAARALARGARRAVEVGGPQAVELLIRERKLAAGDREVELLTRAWVKELRAEARASARAAAEAEAEVEVEAPRRRPRAQAH